VPIILTTSLTIFGGVFIFVVGQVVVKFLLEPLHEQRLMIGEVADGIIYYAQYFGNPGSDDFGGNRTKGSDELRKLSTRLLARSNAVPFYGFFAFIGIAPNPKDVTEAARSLMGISNSFFRGDGVRNGIEAEKVKKLLKLSF
jgi:hypothetical protein